MDFALTERQQAQYDAASAFARGELFDPEATARDQEVRFWREGYERCGKAGFLGVCVPREYGGLGEDVSAAVAAMEGLGFGCPDSGLLFALNASVWTTTLPILAYGSDEQKRRYLPGLCRGTLLGANAVSEPEAGSDVFSMRTRAERRGEEWVLNGGKTWITAGTIADVYLCFAATDSGKGVLGISCFVIDRETPGFRIVREIPKLGVKSVPMGELAFEDCVLPADSLLGRRGRGAQIFNAALEWERGAILAFALGTMRRQLDRCIEHARNRKQFGQSIGRFQSVSNRIVDMMVRLETSRQMIYRYAWLKDQGREKEASVAASMAKLHASESYLQNSLDAVRLFGAAGYAIESGLERDLRDSVGSVIFSGTNDVQRNIIAASLKL